MFLPAGVFSSTSLSWFLSERTIGQCWDSGRGNFGAVFEPGAARTALRVGSSASLSLLASSPSL